MSLRLVRPLRRLALAAGALALLSAVAPVAAWAQSGRVVGRVADPAGAALSDVEINVAGRTALSGADGRFALANVPAGTFDLRARRIGYRPATVGGVVVKDGEEITVAVAMVSEPTVLQEVVVSASRRPERITDAPATVSKIDADEIAMSVGNSFAGALKDVKGLDYVQVGVTSVAVNARGFNSSFNNRMLMMEDGRIAVLPENGLPVGQFTAVPKADLAGIEVLVGPGAALYGADASNGVISLQTKDPKEYPGATLEVAGGNRHYKDVQGRYARVLGQGRFGFKVTGEWQEANDFENFLTYGAAAIPETGIDWKASVARGTGAFVSYLGESRLEVTGGYSVSNGVGQTNLGRNQLVDWSYNFQQAKFASPSFYLNFYRTQSQSGESYAINRYSTNKVLFPSASHDELRLMSDWPSNGRLYAAEAQHNFTLAPLANTRIVWGGQLRHDMVSSDREFLTDRLTGEDIGINQYGVYAQTETPILEQLRLVTAARLDDHENYDMQFSPKVGVVVKPSEDHSFRLTFNRAFKSPTTLMTNFFIPDFVPGIGVFGNRDGFTVRDAGGTVLRTINALVPEENTTWEAGWRGVFAERVLLDLNGYYSKYENFLGSLLAINSLAGGQFVHDAAGQRILGTTNNNQTVLTYQNLGKATIYGVDAGLRVVLTPKIDLTSNFSWLKADSIEASPTDLDATALNSPTTKLGLGIATRDLVKNVYGGFGLRTVHGYDFRSGINRGYIQGFTTTDANLGYRIEQLDAAVQLNVVNLFGCRTTPAGGGSECGFGQKHREMINMPEIGTMVFLGIKYQR